MQKLLIILISVLLLLDFLALDDITTGKESSYSLEFTVLAISVFIFVFIGFYFLKHRKNEK